ncbi:antibiotic biosynthesis monooxygenase [Seongchinamella unica]|uniref:Antibiotic biosynthesis monooxygenase n=1 Tax=Seongchinamella unica TaxID=2547392 RepID=A0A4V6PIX9_9GAMM|nr:antibiotic biosynthesis monooxygenase [Seongchinamella unica]TDG14044.1 antibiotic biosynthesis monooxygenase [Seongchinamella unica]
MSNAQQEDSGPVTISIVRRVLPGRERDYEQWVRAITAEAVGFPGHMGVNVIRPTGASREYVSIFRFDTYRHSRDWEESEVRAQWLARLEGITEGQDEVHRGTGLEFWFSLPELPAHPSPHKMALVLVVVVYVMLTVINLLLAPLTGDLPGALMLLLTVLLQVLLMTYLVMPRVTRLLKPWLFNPKD